MDENQQNNNKDQLPLHKEAEEDIAIDDEFEFDTDEDEMDVMEFEDTPTVQTLLFEKLGGSEAITIVVAEFYRLILEDDQLRPYFHGVPMDKRTKWISFPLL